MNRSAYFLAALASAALPGLDPVAVRRVPPLPADPYDVALVDDADGREWVVQVPRTAVAGALIGDVAELSALLSRRLDIAVPAIKGQVAVPEGRAVVYPRLAGRPLDLSMLPEGLGLAGEVGRALAHVHNLEVALFEEAGRPAYDADTTRSRHLSDLDRAAATGHVPTALLARWERSLEDVSLWRFLPTPVHGSFTGANVLATFEDEGDAGTGRVSAILGWEDAHVGDPAEDFAELAALAPPPALAAVVEAYGPSRIDRPDSHLLARARLSAELRLIRRLLRATAAEERDLVDLAAADLRDLEERVYAEEQRRLTAAAERPPVRRLLRDEADEESESAPQAQVVHEAGGAQEAAHADGQDVSDDRPPPRARQWAADVETVAVPVAEARAEAERASSRTAESMEDGVLASHGDASGSGPGVGGTAETVGMHANGSGVAAAAEKPARPGPEGQDAALHFEIEEAEPLEDGLLDLHEGASEFVPVEPRPRSSGSPESG